MATWLQQFGDWNTNMNAGIFGGKNAAGKMQQASGFGKAMGSLGINAGNIGGIANTIGQLGTGLLAGQNHSAVGDIMQTVGGLASNIPGVGGLIGAGVGVFGGLINAAVGSNINDEFVSQTKSQANALGSRVFNANTNADLLNDWQSMVTQSNVSKSEVGSDGWFSNDASRETRRLNERINEANRRQLANFDIAAQNVDDMNDLRILQNMAAYGGPINSFRKYYDFGGNLFDTPYFLLGSNVYEDGGNTVHQTATRSDMDEEPEYTPGENAGTNYHKYWMSGRQQQMQENMNSSGYSGTAAEETEKQMNNISAHKERYSDPNNPDDAHMYNPIGFTTIMGQARSTRDEEGNLQAGDIVYNDVYKITEGVPDDVIVHERTHAMNLNPWNLSPQESKVDAILREKYGDDVHIAGKYYLRPAEVYAGLMQQRYQLKLSPDYQVTPEDIIKWRDNGMLNEYLRDKDDDILLRLFNEVAYEPMNNQNNVNYAAYGGRLYSKGGHLKQAKALIKQNEGWMDKPYKDSPKGKNWRSVGYGFNDSGFRDKYPEGISKHYEHGITKEQAEEELDYFLNKAEKRLKSIYGKQWNDFSDSQKAAILDTYYQRPASVDKSSRFYKAVTAGEDAGKYLGVAGFNKRNSIRQNVFSGGKSTGQEYSMNDDSENTLTYPSPILEATSPIVDYSEAFAGVTPTQAKALELNFAAPNMDFLASLGQSSQPTQPIPTVGTVEDFLASYGDFEQNLFAGGGLMGLMPAMPFITIDWGSVRDKTDDIKLKASSDLMRQIRMSQNRFNKTDTKGIDIHSTPQDTYLLDRGTQRRIFLKRGFTEAPKDYGLVKTAVGDEDIPVYQQNPDAITRNNLTVIGNLSSQWLGTEQTALEHPGGYPTAIYAGNDGNFYQKAWDLNDYGNTRAAGSTKYKGIYQAFANALDAVGSPTVVTTGYQPILIDGYPFVYTNDGERITRREFINGLMKKKGLYPYEIGGNIMYGLPEVIVTGKKKKAYGGKLNNSDMNIFDFGGGITHGVNWDTGVDYVAEGQSHEQNPYGGVMVGQDEEGTPNLVEEGEYIWNGDYVFSRRMKVPKKLREKYKLPEDATFADAVKVLTKESEERPNDEISRATQDHILGELADSQEELRAAKAQRAMDKQMQLQDDFLMGVQFGLGGGLFADGGGIHIDPSKKGTFKAQASKMGMGVQEAASHILANKEDYSPAMVKKANFARNAAKWHAFGGNLFGPGGKLELMDNPPSKKKAEESEYEDEPIWDPITRKYYYPKKQKMAAATTKQKTATTNTKTKNNSKGASNKEENKPITRSSEEMTPLNTNTRSLTEIFGYAPAEDFPMPEQGIELFDPEMLTKKTIPEGVRTTTIDENGNKVTRISMKKSPFKPKQTWTRYAPVAMQGLMGLKELLTPADYTNANAVMDAAYQVGTPVSMGTEYIGDYRKRDPFDESYLMNIINQNSRAANRNFMNTSGGNRAVAMSGILANDLITQRSLAEAARQAYLANRADDAQVAEFNRGTNIFNAQAQNQRNQYLAGLNSQRQNAMLSGISQGARLRQAIKDQRDAAISSNLSAFAQSLSDIGRENGFYNMLGGLNDEGILKYFYGNSLSTMFNNLNQ